ncbi:MAG: DUF2520 domain-containing protein [Porticoccaceae bacterium]|jgi:predicted short-subunit dehydrogenase-like oxidoreductase (DUF2520 family)|nr:DUF2520 domain-containing protein [Porticoccaceae bacterium]MBT4165201.1 DUF2520 domain-containing protein [Porticoccaceae bacterium]MBT4590993.1 DUF2520 domain-containing protein [Porticoccaceae bacterium]MBT5104470.1 DUF2520 domain-containing protein [Porticoccaceae bacterium]MBT6423069.1 DUF2520 domain-containing protein [Porticoccaceae bacterium]
MSLQLSNSAHSNPLSLSCIGAGRTGSSLCNLLTKHVTIKQIINRSAASAEYAVNFIGAGDPIALNDAGYHKFQPADLWMISTPDDHIEEAVQLLIDSDVLQADNIVFHCSGAIGSNVLSRLNAMGVHVGSIHPIHSFANPQNSIANLKGVPFAIEGDADAIDLLNHLCIAIGGQPFAINSDSKSLYHAATVMACNNLVSLLEISMGMLVQAGVDVKNSGNPLDLLIKQTVTNYLSSGGQKALTGPVARGDVDTVASHLLALQSSPDGWQDAYRGLSKMAVEISAKQGQASTEQLQDILQLLNIDTNNQTGDNT